MTPQPGMRPQFPTPPMNKQQVVGTIGAQGTPQQLQMQQVQQAVQRPSGLSQAQMGTQQVFYDKTGLTQQQLLAQHAKQLQQPQVPQHQQQPQSLLMQQSLNVTPLSQAGHHQMAQSQTHVNVPPGQVGSPMPVQQQPVHPGTGMPCMSALIYLGCLGIIFCCLKIGKTLDFAKSIFLYLNNENTNIKTTVARGKPFW